MTTRRTFLARLGAMVALLPLKPLLAFLVAALALSALCYFAEERTPPAESGSMWETSLDAWRPGDVVSTTTGKVLVFAEEPVARWRTGDPLPEEALANSLHDPAGVVVPSPGAVKAAGDLELERLREMIRGVHGWHQAGDWKVVGSSPLSWITDGCVGDPSGEVILCAPGRVPMPPTGAFEAAEKAQKPVDPCLDAGWMVPCVPLTPAICDFLATRPPSYGSRLCDSLRSLRREAEKAADIPAGRVSEALDIRRCLDP